MLGAVYNYGRKYHRRIWTDNMKPNDRRIKGKKHRPRDSYEYIIVRIPRNNPEPTIECLVKKYSCKCEVK